MNKSVQAELLYELCERAAVERGLNEQHAIWFAQGLIRTSLMGIDTHGVRLLPLYLRELDEGRSNVRPKIQTIQQFHGTALVDADSALGVVAGAYAANLANELAREYGVSVVAVANSNHFGAASVYGERIASQGLVGIVTTSAAARMAPFNAKRAMFGTNPICFAAPARGTDLYLLDMATSQISYSQVKHFRRNGVELPPGWALDRNGRQVSDPALVESLATLGGYKGQGLAMMVQILSCLLTSMPFDHRLSHLDAEPYDRGRQIGHCLIAIDPARFGSLDDFTAGVSELMQTIRETPAVDGECVQVAGDPQKASIARRTQEGIPLNDDELHGLSQEAQRLGLTHIFPRDEALYKEFA
ncbi:Ldh family oxidoreductase [Paraburkholderia susongensis]|uniref:Malate/lactate/ureidoglycolate dehydrogenase, LDH2 family n=1 Tax=Paraburkholderia susongensis TaxID=1515439 RepID=A0A1X7HWN0_9BURK|nr:Ldh family oxidoreductase [Paraburkholderia susongensis]SMG05725.1 Malate/lactate/ureidoglycolate dehydrogenase, LDH2 family [Paraburkholderia susongensis]